MHHISNIASRITDVFQLLSKFFSKMTESGILKTYTFLYSENHSCVDKNLENIVGVIDELKAVLLKICSQLPASSKTLLEHQNTYLLSNSSMNNDCVSGRQNIAFSRNDDDFTLYTNNTIHDSIERNLQYITDDETRMCSSIEHGFSSQEIGAETLKSTERNMFSQCSSISSLLKEDDHAVHAISYSEFKKNLENRSQSNVNSLHDVHDSLKNCDTPNLDFSKNDTNNIDQTIERKIDSLSNMKYSGCADSLYNSMKNDIGNDFLQSMKFSATETQNRAISETSVNFNEHVQYSQCENALPSIDLNILNRNNNSYQQSNYIIRNNERINPNFDRIFDDQFPENESILESECWNVDINLPSTEQISSNLDIPTSSFDISACSSNLKNKTLDSNLEESLVSELDNRLESNLEDPMPSASATFSVITKNERSNEFERNRYFCEHCENVFDTKLKLKIHLKRKHNVQVNNINKCEQCGKVFKKKATLLTHVGIHCEIKPFKCPYCWKTFTQKITRDSHIQLHTGMYKFSCKICQKRFPTQAKLNFHSKSHGVPEWQCDICSKMFTTKQYLNVHKKSHFKRSPALAKGLSCIECNLLFGKKRDLLSHINESHPEIKFMCYYAGCSRTYPTYKKMADHIYKKHSAKSTCTADSIKKSSKFRCTMCGINFIEKNSFHRHNLLAHCAKIDVKNSFSCIHCDRRFTTKLSLDEHVDKFHRSSHSKDLNYSSLKDHIEIHSDGLVFAEKSNFLINHNVGDVKEDITARKFRCETCDVRFENKMELKQHELDAHDIVPNMEELKPYFCSFCDKRFTTRGKCNLHMETHSKERNYKCTKCEKRFYRRDLLKEHMNTHNGYRAHVCKLCGLAYSQKSSLKAHESTHEKAELTINCEQCQKIFHSKQALNFHLKTHEGVFRFACEVCGKQFVRKCHYDLHVVSHSVERPFKCSKCPASYKTSKHLREHSKKTHQNEPNFSSLFDSIYTEDEVVGQQNLLDEYIPSINALDSELIFAKGRESSF